MIKTLNKSESLVYRCRIFDVYEVDVQLPGGRTVRQTRVDHKPTIAVVPMDRDGSLILLRQYRSALDQYLIEIPAGGLNQDEPIEDCVQRELAEEAGFQAGRLVKLFEGALVEQQLDALARRELAAIVLRVDACLTAAETGILPALFQLFDDVLHGGSLAARARLGGRPSGLIAWGDARARANSGASLQLDRD